MKKWRKQITIILVVLVTLSVGYVFCIPCQFFGWMPMPSIEEVLISSTSKPKTISEVYTLNPSSKSLCVSIDMNPLIQQNPEHDFYKDVMEQWPNLDRAYKQSIRYYVDNFRRVVTFTSLLTQYKSDNPCVDTDGLVEGQHVAHVSFEAPFGQLHEYTWVFEVKADGIVPEVTATPSLKASDLDHTNKTSKVILD